RKTQGGAVTEGGKGMVLRTFYLILLLTFSHNNAFGSSATSYTLKFATLMPTGTAWTKILDDWVKEVETKSNGRIQFKMYSGGVMGDEPDVLRKIRKGQLDGGLFTGYGIGYIYSPARVLEMPFLFKNTNESDYVREQIMPELEVGFRSKGFELLGWPEVGFIHFFSTQTITSIDDIKKLRIWLWQGDPLGEAFFNAAGINPIPLSIMDVYTQLSARHGSIDTVYTSTFGAIALQWYSKLKYATRIPLTNAIGGLIVSNRFYNKLPPDLQQLLKTSGKTLGDQIRLSAREENQKSITILEKNGIEFMLDWDDVDMDKILTIRDNAATYLEQTNYIPTSMFAKTQKILADYRARHADQANDGSNIGSAPGTAKPTAQNPDKSTGSAENPGD
ncbi:MAG: TRAP transporter substrate-binding protein DctP, partial [Gammaproteobacteria bacterium]|nr:TRAP transporter substrate-binding protein DctP [Gammaproteobacteria bacterium]